MDHEGHRYIVARQKDLVALKPSALTAREHEVFALVARGQSNLEIADALHLSPLTAKTHVSRILNKLNARDRVQLVITAYETGLVTAPH